MSTQELSATEAAEYMAELSENSGSHRRIRATGIGVHEPTIRANGYETNRWTKYGKDRLYFKDRLDKGNNGYIDLETGAVEGSTPIVEVDVEKSSDGVWTLYYALIEDLDGEEPELVAALKR